MYLPRQPRGVLVPDPVLWKGEILMSTYEEMQILLTFALLVVAILNLKHRVSRPVSWSDRTAYFVKQLYSPDRVACTYLSAVLLSTL